MSRARNAWRRARGACPLLAAALLGLAGCARAARPAADVEGLYRRHCARCHGPDGKGDPRSVGLNPNLNLTTALTVVHRDRGQIYRRIAYGYGPMPAFAHKLDERDIERLTVYTIELAKR